MLQVCLTVRIIQMRSRWSKWVLFACCLAMGCEDDIRTTATPEIVVEPTSLVFPGPEAGATVRTRSLNIRNTGQGNLLIASIRLTEDDPITEFFLRDADDWAGAVRTVPPESEVMVSVDWRVQDAQPDTGSLVIQHNAGDDVVVPLSTLDLDATMRVQTTPEGEAGENEITVTLANATPTVPQRSEIVISSESVAPLEIESVCLVGDDSNCVADLLDDDWRYRLCDGTPASADACVLPQMDVRLALGETKTLSVFFRPRPESADVLSTRVLITTNAAGIPAFTVNYRGQRCVRMAAGDVCGGCGDGEVTGNEACDDGNFDETDACRNDCTATRCGDGIVDANEACDDGNAIDTDDCLSNCVPAACGDGAVWAEREVCDDGNDVDGDGCDGNCTVSACGNGVVAPNEECDDTNDVETDDCLSDCTLATCGDGQTWADREVCDDGNDVEGDGCDSNCTVSACGNGVVAPGEACDDGNDVDGDGCDRGCVLPGCGNGVVGADEECDDGNAETETCAYGEAACAVCRADCTIGGGIVLRCGDGRTDGPEACDDGDELDTNACTTDCALAACGDGHVWAGEEECDHGGEVVADCAYGERDCQVCTANCRFGPGDTAFCGDGTVNGLEECDGGEGCQPDCTAGPVRGDGEYGEPCACGNDCASGFCLNTPRDGGRCTALCGERDDCPGLDQCLDATYPAPSAECPDPGLDFEEGDPIRLCAPNETGQLCAGPDDCVFGSVCLTPPAPLPRVNVQRQCGALCEVDDHCPTGYRCDLITIDQRRFNICQPAVEISQCIDGTNRTCGGICPLEGGERDVDVAHCVIVDGVAPGYCTCSCRDVSDCPVGFACGRGLFDSGDPARPGMCVAMAGYVCPGGPNGGNACLSLVCYDDEDDDRAPQCVALCNGRADCPDGYACRAVDNGAATVCLPE